MAHKQRFQLNNKTAGLQVAADPADSLVSHERLDLALLEQPQNDKLQTQYSSHAPCHQQLDFHTESSNQFKSPLVQRRYDQQRKQALESSWGKDSASKLGSNFYEMQSENLFLPPPRLFMTETKEPLKSSTIQNVFLPPTANHNSQYDKSPSKQSLNFTDRSNQTSNRRTFQATDHLNLRIPTFPEETEAPSAIQLNEASCLSMMDLEAPQNNSSSAKPAGVTQRPGYLSNSDQIKLLEATQNQQPEMNRRGSSGCESSLFDISQGGDLLNDQSSIEKQHQNLLFADSPSDIASQLRQSQFVLGHPVSLLSDSYNKQQSCLFMGDRFIPMRPEELNYQGAEQYRFEEIRLLQSHMSANPVNDGSGESNQMGGNSRRRRNSDASNNSADQDAISQGSRDSNSNHSDYNSQNSNSEDGDHSMNLRNARVRQEVYRDLLSQQCFGSENLPQLQRNNLSNPSNGPSHGEHQPLQKLAEAATKKQEKIPRRSQILKFKKRRSNKIFMTHSPSLCGQDENISPHYLLDLENDQTAAINQSVLKTRKVSKVPYKVLDAPQLQDDFYLNLVDWSSQNVLAVGLMGAVYIWSAHTSQVQKLCEVDESDAITSVNWSQRGNHLAVGTQLGITQIWDANSGQLVRSFGGHAGRVSAIAWNTSTVSTGSKDKSIQSRDLREGNQYYSKLISHKQEVCGLKWSFDNQQLASGGNDNKLMIWSLHSDKPLVKFSEHTAAVKAIGWSPHQNSLLATGGGTADRHIRFWNTHTLQPLHAIDTGSQVCNLMFSKNSQEIVSTHGYSLNSIILWKFPTMQKIQTLTGHQYRVLYLSMSPDGESIVTGAGDETLRFWNLFPAVDKRKKNLSQLFPSSMDLR